MRWRIAIGSALAVLTGAVVTLLIFSADTVDVPFEIAKWLMNLTVAVAVTGVLTVLINNRNLERARSDERSEIVTEALQELKAAYEEGIQLRFLLGAHPSARIYLDQFPAIGQVRARLQRVQRERHILQTPVDDKIQAMLDYMRLLAEEYRDNYRLIVRDAAREEAALDKVRTGAADDVELSELDPGRFPRLYAFLNEKSFGAGGFQQSYGAAKRQLQEWLLASSSRTVVPERAAVRGTPSA